MSGGEAKGPGWVPALVLAAAVVVADQAAKALVRGSLVAGERVDFVLGIEFARISNRGIAFGFLGGGGDLVLVVTGAALVAMLVWFALAPASPGRWVAVGLLLGGAVGNLIDRVRLDAVTDFIDPPLWPAFNLADIAITIGAISLVLAVLRAPETEAEPG